MAEKRKYFFKMKTEYFTRNVDLRKLRQGEHGSDKVLIYHELMADSLENLGHVYLDGTLDEYCEDMALLFYEDPDIVKETIQDCIKHKLFKQVSKHEYVFTRVELITCSETEAAERMRKLREKRIQEDLEEAPDEEQAYDQIDEVPERNTSEHVCNNSEQCSELLRLGEQACNACEQNRTKFLELEYKNIELDLENKRIESESETRVVESSQSDFQEEKNQIESFTYQQIVNAYNKICPTLPKVVNITDTRKNKMDKILEDYTFHDIETVFAKADKSPFLRGDTKDFKTNFDALMSPEFFRNVIDGAYDKYAGRDSPGSSMPMNKTAQKLKQDYEMLTNWANN